jgi:amino acid transporter
MKKLSLLAFLMLGAVSTLHAQEETKNPLKSLVMQKCIISTILIILRTTQTGICVQPQQKQ